MKLTSQARWKQVGLLVLSILCAADMWIYWNRLTRSISAAETSATRPKPLSDCYSRWYGARELILHHRDPYGPEVSRDLQVAFYGRALDASRPGEARDEERFAYPLYVVFLFAPFIGMDFDTVHMVFWWLLAAATVGSAALWYRFLRISLSWIECGTLLAFLLGSIGVVQGLNLLQLGLLVSFFISLAAFCAASEQMFLAGTFLAFATIKPQLALLPVLWFAVWTCGEWRQRKNLLIGFTVSLGVLILGSEYLDPGWVWRYPAALRSYAGYFGNASVLGVLLFHSPFQWVVDATMALVAGWFCWRERRQAADSTSSAIGLGLALALTASIMPAVIGPFNQVLLVPAILLLIQHGYDLWHANNLSRFAVATMFCCLLLPFLFALILTLTPSALRQSWTAGLWLMPISASLALPLAAYCFLAQARRLTWDSEMRRIG